MPFSMQYVNPSQGQQNPINNYAIPNNKVLLQNSQINASMNNSNINNSSLNSNLPPTLLNNSPVTMELDLTQGGLQNLKQQYNQQFQQKQHKQQQQQQFISTQQQMIYASSTAFNHSASSNTSLQPPPPPKLDYFQENLEIKKDLQAKKIEIQSLYQEITKLRTQMKEKERTNSQLTEYLDRLSRTPKEINYRLSNDIVYQQQQQHQQQQQSEQLPGNSALEQQEQKDSNNLMKSRDQQISASTPVKKKTEIKSRSLYEICEQKNDYYQQFASHPNILIEMMKVLQSFSNQIIEFSREVQQRLEDQRPIKDAVIKKATQIIVMAIPNADVQVYGSHATELCLPWSDIDLVVNLPNGVLACYQSRSKLEEVQFKMNEQKEFVKKCELIKAAIPVLKLVCQDKEFGGFNVDITIQDERHNGLRCVSLVKTFLQQYQSLKPMVLMLKELLKNSNQNDPYRGGLSSYGLTLLCISHLEKRQPSPLGQTLLSFLYDYSFIYNTDIDQIQVKLPNDYMNRYQKYEDKFFNSPYFCSNKCPIIVDPLSSMNNVGKSAYNFYYIQKIFARAYFAGIAEIRYRVIENLSSVRYQNISDSFTSNNQRVTSADSNNSCNNSAILSSSPPTQQHQTRKLVSKSVLECIVTSASDLFDSEQKHSVLMYLNDHANSNLAIMGGRVGMIGGAVGSNNYNQFMPLNSLTPGSNSSSSAASSQQLTHLTQSLGYNHHNHHHHHHNHQQHHHHNNTSFFNQNYGANLPQTFEGIFAQNIQNNSIYMGQSLGGQNSNNGASSLSPNNSNMYVNGNMF